VTPAGHRGEGPVEFRRIPEADGVDANPELLARRPRLLDDAVGYVSGLGEVLLEKDYEAGRSRDKLPRQLEPLRAEL
jgi:hypothetical protein